MKGNYYFFFYFLLLVSNQFALSLSVGEEEEGGMLSFVGAPFNNFFEGLLFWKTPNFDRTPSFLKNNKKIDYLLIKVNLFNFFRRQGPQKSYVAPKILRRPIFSMYFCFLQNFYKLKALQQTFIIYSFPDMMNCFCFFHIIIRLYLIAVLIPHF